MNINVLNKARKDLEGKTLSKEAIVTCLKESQVKYPEYVFKHLKDANVLLPMGKGKYTFKKDPILYSVIETGEKLAAKRQATYENKSNKQVIGREEVFKNAEKSIPVISAEESAIDFLKKKGYKIFKYVEV